MIVQPYSAYQWSNFHAHRLNYWHISQAAVIFI